MNGILIEAYSFAAPVGHLCELSPRHARTSIKAQVMGYRVGHSLLAALNEVRDIPKPSELRRVRILLDLGIRTINGLGIGGQGQWLASVLETSTQQWHTLFTGTGSRG